MRIRRCDHGCDGGFHIGGAAAMKLAVFYLAGEWIAAPALSRRHDIDMAGKTKVRLRCSEAGIQIVDLAEFQTLRLEADALQSALCNIQRAGFKRRHAWRADQFLCEGDWINHEAIHSRWSSSAFAHRRV